MALFVSWCSVLVGAQAGFASQGDASTAPLPPQAAKQSPEQLQQLVAPIALYPGRLIAQILAAATYSDELMEAGKSMESHDTVPAVLANINQHLAWTSELGGAHVNDPEDLNQAIQTMRQRAQQAGNLKTTPQETVSTNANTIVIQQAAPDVVYVPQYDPWLVYGAHLAMFPGWYPYPGLFWDGPGIGFGLGFGIGVFAGFGWGWGHWGYNWHGGGRVGYKHNTYISHGTTVVNRNSFHPSRTGFNHASASRAMAGTRSGAFSGLNHGGLSRVSSFRGQSSFGGFHGGGFGGGFHDGGFHGGGGRR
jgi:hypothetical protein